MHAAKLLEGLRSWHCRQPTNVKLGCGRLHQLWAVCSRRRSYGAMRIVREGTGNTDNTESIIRDSHWHSHWHSQQHHDQQHTGKRVCAPACWPATHL